MKSFILSFTLGIFVVGNALADCASDEVLGLATGNCIKKSGDCGSNCTYTIDQSGKLVITGATTEGETGIISKSFSYDQDITNIEITGNISEMVWQGFGYMPNVSTIKVGDNINIGSYAFRGNAATTVSIGKVESVGYIAFSEMPNLANVTFADGSNPSFDAYVFTDSGGENGPTIVLPEGLTSIPSYALGGMTNANIIIPDSLTNIDWAIYAYGSNYTTYCSDSPQRDCSSIFNGPGYGGAYYSPSTYTPYSKEDGMYVLEDGDNKTYFASALNMTSGRACENTNTEAGLNACKAKVLENQGKYCKTERECTSLVEQANQGTFAVNGKFYASLNDLFSGKYMAKRIYTVSEASNVASPKGNTFSIRYR